LRPEEIAEAIAKVFQRPTPTQILSRLAVAAIAIMACLLGGWTLTLFWGQRPEAFVLGFGVFSLICLLLFAQPYPRMYGMRLPVGRDWGLLFVLAVVGGGLGGTWFPSGVTVEKSIHDPLLALMLSLALPFSAEVLFRGVVHGLLAEKLSSQRKRGRWFLSWPVVLSTLIYAAASLLEVVPKRTVIPFLTWVSSPHELVTLGVNLAGLLIFGAACGMARERSESVVAPILFHWLAAGFLAIWLLS
jgi:hypothetical protein